MMGWEDPCLDAAALRLWARAGAGLRPLPSVRGHHHGRSCPPPPLLAFGLVFSRLLLAPPGTVPTHVQCLGLPARPLEPPRPSQLQGRGQRPLPVKTHPPLHVLQREVQALSPEGQTTPAPCG